MDSPRDQDGPSPAPDGQPPGLAGLAWKQAKRLAVLVVGGTVLLIGLALLVLPGPAFVVIPLGLVILSTEFLWARRLLRKVKQGAKSLGQAAGLGRKEKDASEAGDPVSLPPRCS